MTEREVLELKARLSRGDLPRIDAPELIAPGDTCHFVCAVRFGRRRADQFGHVVLSATWLRFRGALDVRVGWSQIASVRREGHDIVVALPDSTRLLRFSCHSDSEAERGAIIAEHLAGLAPTEPNPPPREYHASA